MRGNYLIEVIVFIFLSRLKNCWSCEGGKWKCPVWKFIDANWSPCITNSSAKKWKQRLLNVRLLKFASSLLLSCSRVRELCRWKAIGESGFVNWGNRQSPTSWEKSLSNLAFNQPTEKTTLKWHLASLTNCRNFFSKWENCTNKRNFW